MKKKVINGDIWPPFPPYKSKTRLNYSFNSFWERDLLTADLKFPDQRQ